MAREGCDLVLGGRLADLPDGTPYPKATGDDLQTTEDAVQAQGVRYIALKVDDEASILVRRVGDSFSRLDFLVANASLWIDGPIAEMRPDTFDTVMRANPNGLFHVLSPALKLMLAAKRGRVVVIGSGVSKHVSRWIRT